MPCHFGDVIVVPVPIHRQADVRLPSHVWLGPDRSDPVLDGQAGNIAGQ